MPFSVAADRVVDGWWTVVRHDGAVARRVVREGGRTVHAPAVFRTRDAAENCARRLNAHLASVEATRR